MALIGILTFVAIVCAVESTCTEGSLARYRVTFNGEWSEQRFPNQYPQFRPHAQWSKMIGRTHNDDYKLWSKGAVASFGMKEFVQDAESDRLDQVEVQGFNGVYDAFFGPPVKQGVGQSQADFIAVSTHSKVSVAIRLIPSPDWFVGVDSVDLCADGSWKRDFTIALDPLDAGTDRGYTFTSPNWASHPPQRIFQITSRFPNHRASSFYYPDMDALPQLGQLNFQLLDDYYHNHQHAEVLHVRDDLEELNKNASEIERKREELEEKLILAGEPLGQVDDSDEKVGNLDELQEDGLRPVHDNSIQATAPDKHPKKKDCIVKEWSDWSQCSKTCGFGIQKRQREVTQKPQNGLPCPALEEDRWCGSMRGCRTNYFSWLDRKA